ncbi:MAG: T9SS type A sorting domain-containing protein [Patescibacteria group bacterium]
MKTFSFILLFLFVSFSVFSQQKIKTENGWNLYSFFAKPIDSLATRSEYGTFGQVFKIYGISDYLTYYKKWLIFTNWDKNFTSNLTPDKILVDLKIQKKVNFDSVTMAIGLKDSVGHYWRLDADWKKIDSNQRTMIFDMAPIKNHGVISYRKILLAFWIWSGDSIYTGCNVLVRNIKGVDSLGNTFAIDLCNVTAVSESKQNPKEFALEQNYPNPFNPSTTIKFSVPQKGYVNLVVFNLLGQEIQNLVSGEKEQGSYKVKFNASHFPSGIYFYKLQTGAYVETKKMFFLK